MVVKNIAVNNITVKIKSSRKYRSLWLKTIERIVADCQNKYPAGLIEAKSRNLLHQIWSAYYFGYFGRPNFNKLFLKIKEDLKNGKTVKEALSAILEAQSSTRERLPVLADFYKQVFEVTGIPKSIVDYGCGLNPLTISWASLPETAAYRAFDIDEEEIAFLKQVFSFLEEKRVKPEVGDVLIDRPIKTEMVFMLKLLPVLEKQEKGSAKRIINSQKCRFLVVSFPRETLSGKDKGMTEFYGSEFEKTAEKEGWKIIKKLLFPKEQVFVIIK